MCFNRPSIFVEEMEPTNTSFKYPVYNIIVPLLNLKRRKSVALSCFLDVFVGSYVFAESF